jgi:hypothetical protein
MAQPFKARISNTFGRVGRLEPRMMVEPEGCSTSKATLSGNEERQTDGEGVSRKKGQPSWLPFVTFRSISLKRKGVSLIYSASALAQFLRLSCLVQFWFGSAKFLLAIPGQVRRPPEEKERPPDTLEKPPTNTPPLGLCRAHEPLECRKFAQPSPQSRPR